MLSLILAQASGEGGGYFQFIFLAGIFLVFYFFMIRPQQKKQKEQKKWISEISKGDEVVTIGGIHGKVLSVDDETVLIEIDRGVKITVNKASLSLEASKPANAK
jgi:preprotein translocase subunit YajC